MGVVGWTAYLKFRKLDRYILRRIARLKFFYQDLAIVSEGRPIVKFIR